LSEQKPLAQMTRQNCVALCAMSITAGVSGRTRGRSATASVAQSIPKANGLSKMTPFVRHLSVLAGSANSMSMNLRHAAALV
jgi:hypothetical protein